jgi:hypothetical protein
MGVCRVHLRGLRPNYSYGESCPGQWAGFFSLCYLVQPILWLSRSMGRDRSWTFTLVFPSVAEENILGDNYF